RALAALWCVISLWWSPPALSQACCGPPTVSLAGAERGVDPTAPLTISVSYSFTHFTRTANGTATIPDPLGRRALSHLWRAEAELVLHPGWSVLVSLPLTFKERRLQIDTLAEVYRAAGLGDAMALLKHDLSPRSLLSPWSIALGTGFKAPTGPSDLERNGVRLPRDIQPGTGTWEALAWGLIAATSSDALFSLVLSTMVRVPLHANALGYQTGTELQALLVGNWLDCPATWLLPGLALRLRMTTPDYLNGQPFPATGGIWVDVLPALTVLAEPFAARLQGTVPVFRRTRGPQLVHTWGITAESRWSPKP
ncbi:MAG: hypothetical protein NZ949_04115, partial [Candidatus Kapabacteria bacterium]|nr:hypothetical protein [Candidatus Kapabacteria bacterium]